MPRQRFQRPEVKRIGAKRKQQWAAHYFVYVRDGDAERRVHKLAKFGRCSEVTKAKAQEDCDRFMAGINSRGAAPADARMTLAQWWEQAFKPVRAGHWSVNTRTAYEYTWRKHIEPHVGGVRLCDTNKLTIDRLLLKLSTAGLGEQIVQRVRVMLHSMMEEALDNDVIPKNPARKVELPICKAPKETRSLTEDEVYHLWNALEGQDYLLFRVLLMCGPRPNEVFALRRDDFLGSVLRIDESTIRGRVSTTKNKKTRFAPVPKSLRAELEGWLAEHPGTPDSPIFPAPRGGMTSRDMYGREIQERAREASGISDLTYRMCRTTFGTLFNGDIRDAQDILGHHSASFTLDHYRKPVSERAAQAVEEMDRRLTKVVPIRKGA